MRAKPGEGLRIQLCFIVGRQAARQSAGAAGTDKAAPRPNDRTCISGGSTRCSSRLSGIRGHSAARSDTKASLWRGSLCGSGVGVDVGNYELGRDGMPSALW